MDIFIQQHSGHFALIWISILVHWPFAFNKNSSKANKTKQDSALESCAPEVIKRGETMASVQPETEVDADKHQIRKGAMGEEGIGKKDTRRAKAPMEQESGAEGELEVEVEGEATVTAEISCPFPSQLSQMIFK